LDGKLLFEPYNRLNVECTAKKLSAVITQNIGGSDAKYWRLLLGILATQNIGGSDSKYWRLKMLADLTRNIDDSKW
jgi:hypothetical protein